MYIQALDWRPFPVYTPHMSDTARDYQTIEPSSVEGLEQIFEVDAPDVIEVREHEQEDANQDQGGRETDAYLSVDEAAQKLKISVRAIQKRLKRGTLKGLKVKVGAGERWLIDRAAILKSMDAPDVIEVREQEQEDANQYHDGREMDAYLCEHGRETDASVAHDHYKDSLIKDLQSKLEGASYRVGYLEAKLEEKETQIRLLTDSQHKGSWWADFKKWFFGH